MSNYDEEGMYAYSRSVCDEVSEALSYTIFITPRHMRRRVTAVVMFICVCIYHENMLPVLFIHVWGSVTCILGLKLKRLVVGKLWEWFLPSYV